MTNIGQLPVNFTVFSRNKKYTTIKIHNLTALMTGYRVQPHIKSFLKEITLQQLEALYLGFPDNASIILLMAMILKLVLGVTESLVKNVVTIRANHLEENAELYLEKSLFYSLSEALGVPTNVENRTLQILKMMIWHESKENAAFFLTQVQYSDIIIQITPPSKLNKMAALFIKLFKEFRPGLSHTKNQESNKEWESKTDERTSSSKREDVFPEDNLEISIQDEIRKRLSDITASLLDEVSDCFYEKIQSEIHSEIQSITEEPSSLLKENGKKIQYFCSKWFLKVWLCRMLQWLNKKYPRDTKAGQLEIIDSIIKGLIATYAESSEPTNINSLLMILTNFPCEKIQDFAEELSDLIFKHVLVEKQQESVFKDYCPKRWSNPKPQARIDVDIWRSSCICIAMMNWFHNSQTEGIVEVPSEDIQDEINVTIPRHGHDAEIQMIKVYVNLFVEKVVFHMCSEAKVTVDNTDKLLNGLFKSVWLEVRNEKLCITPKTFKKLDETIHCGLCKKYGLIQVVDLMNSVHPIVVGFLISFIRQKLLTPNRKNNPNHVHRFLSNVGRHLKKSFRVVCDRKMSDVYLLI